MTGPEASWLELFRSLRQLAAPHWQRLQASVSMVRPPVGTVLFTPGDPCDQFLMIAAGSARVQLTAENGREIVLYRILPGQTCLLTTAGILARGDYCAEGIAEAGLLAAAFPVNVFNDLLDQSDAFRRFVFDTYGQRLAELMTVVQEVGFGRVDMRLARLLVERAGTKDLEATHQMLASELGTAREVVSRQLKTFERRGWVLLDRGVIRVRDPAALSRLATLVT